MSIEPIDAARGDTITKWAEAIADRQSSRLPPSSVHPSTPPAENTVELSPAAELLAKVEMLAQTDPARFRSMVSQVYQDLQAGGTTAPSGPGSSPGAPYAQDTHSEQQVQAVLNAVMDQIYAAIGRIV